MAFGGVLILIALLAGHDPSGFLATGHWKMNSVILLAIPLFIMAGQIMEKGKIAKPIVEIAELVFGHLRGGLSAASVLASGMFGAISGSAAATLTCIGSIIMPHLRKANYPEGFSAALLNPCRLASSSDGLSKVGQGILTSLALSAAKAAAAGISIPLSKR